MSTEVDERLPERLAERLAQLADELDTPVVPPEEDLDRGRRRQRTQRWGVACAAVATLAVVGGALTLVPLGDAGAHHGQPVAGGGGHSGSTQTARANKEAAAKAAAKAARRAERRAATARLTHGLGLDPRLGRFYLAVSEGLDPQHQHLDPLVTNVQSRGRHIVSLGTKLGWHDGGTGLGEIFVHVGPSIADAGGWLEFTCADGNTGGHPCGRITLPDGTVGLQQQYDGHTTVFYTRPDGEVVTLSESTLFGNNSTVPVAKLPVTAEQLLRTATDPRLTLAR